MKRFTAWQNLLLNLSGTNLCTWALLGVCQTARFIEIKVGIEAGKYSVSF